MVWSKHYARQNVIGKKEMQRRFPGIFPVLGAVRSTIYLCHHCNKPFPVPVTGVAVGRQVNRSLASITANSASGGMTL